MQPTLPDPPHSFSEEYLAQASDQLNALLLADSPKTVEEEKEIFKRIDQLKVAMFNAQSYLRQQILPTLPETQLSTESLKPELAEKKVKPISSLHVALANLKIGEEIEEKVQVSLTQGHKSAQACFSLGDKKAFFILNQKRLVLIDASFISNQVCLQFLQAKVPANIREQITIVDFSRVRYLSAAILPQLFSLFPNSIAGTLATIRGNGALHDTVLTCKQGDLSFASEVVKGQSPPFYRWLKNCLEKEMEKEENASDKKELDISHLPFSQKTVATYLDILHFTQYIKDLDFLDLFLLGEWLAYLGEVKREKSVICSLINRLKRLGPTSQLSFAHLVQLKKILNELQGKSKISAISSDGRLQKKIEKIFKCHILNGLANIKNKDQREVALFKKSIELIDPAFDHVYLDFSSHRMRLEPLYRLHSFLHVKKVALKHGVFESADANISLFKMLASLFPSLKNLTLEAIAFAKSDYSDLTLLPSLRKLTINRCCHIGGNKLKAANLQPFSELKKLKNLKKLKLLASPFLLQKKSDYQNLLQNLPLKKLTFAAAAFAAFSFDPKSQLSMTLEKLSLHLKEKLDSSLFSSINEMPKLRELAFKGTLLYPNLPTREVKVTNPALKELRLELLVQKKQLNTLSVNTLSVNTLKIENAPLSLEVVKGEMSKGKHLYLLLANILPLFPHVEKVSCNGYRSLKKEGLALQKVNALIDSLKKEKRSFFFEWTSER